MQAGPRESGAERKKHRRSRSGAKKKDRRFFKRLDKELESFRILESMYGECRFHNGRRCAEHTIRKEISGLAKIPGIPYCGDGKFESAAELLQFLDDSYSQRYIPNPRMTPEQNAIEEAHFRRKLASRPPFGHRHQNKFNHRQ